MWELIKNAAAALMNSGQAGGMLGNAAGSSMLSGAMNSISQPGSLLGDALAASKSGVMPTTIGGIMQQSIGEGLSSAANGQMSKAPPMMAMPTSPLPQTMGSSNTNMGRSRGLNPQWFSQ